MSPEKRGAVKRGRAGRERGPGRPARPAGLRKGLLFLRLFPGRLRLGGRLRLLALGRLLLAEDGVVALGELLGLGEADANDAHEWSSALLRGRRGVLQRINRSRRRFTPRRPA